MTSVQTAEGIRPLVNVTEVEDSSAGRTVGGDGGVDEGEQGEVYDAIDPEEAFVKVLPSPALPSQKEVDSHSVLHLPYRDWCPACVKAKGREDGHPKVATKREGKPIAVMDYKSYNMNAEEEADEKITSIVMRDQSSGMLHHISVKSKDRGTIGSWTN